MRIHIRPWIFCLASFQEDVRRDIVDLTNKLEERILRKVLEREFALGGVTRILRVVRDQHKKWRIPNSKVGYSPSFSVPHGRTLGRPGRL